MELNQGNAEAGQIPPGYKLTEVGVIPEDWEVHRLGEGIQLLSGHHVLAHYCNTDGDGVPYITGPSDFPKGSIQHTKFTTKPVTICNSNDVLVTVKGSGVGTLVLSDSQYCISRQLMAIRVIAWNTSYIYFSFLQNAVLFGATATGLIPGLSRSDILNKTIPLPPTKAEQEAIAKALGDADDLIESLEQLVTKKRQIKQGAMQELLRPKPSDEVRLLRDVSTLKGRIGWQGLNQTEFTSNEDEPFLITGMNFKDGAIRWNEVYHISEPRYEMAKDIQLRMGDVLMTKDGTIGKVLYIDAIPYPGKASLNSHLLLFRPIRESYNSMYLYYQLSSQRFKDFIELSKYGTTFFGISQAAVGNYSVLLPLIEDQERIANILSDMAAEITELDLKLSKARLLKQGMMQELLTGRIRLL